MSEGSTEETSNFPIGGTTWLSRLRRSCATAEGFLLVCVFDHVSFAEVSDGGNRALAHADSGGIFAPGNDATQTKSLKARLLRGHVASMAPDCHPIVAAALPVLKDIDTLDCTPPMRHG